MGKLFPYFLLAVIFGSCTKSVDTPGTGGSSDTQPPSAPGNVSGTATYYSVQLTWTPSSDNTAVTGYKIFRNGVQAGVTPANSFTDNTILPNTAYTYTISAYDAAGNNSGLSPEYRITTLQADTASIMTGHWQVLKDSVSNVGNFYFVQGGINYFPNSGTYFGTAADYWDFGSNGMLAMQENGNVFSNIPYHFAGNGRLFINQLSTTYNDAFIVQLNNNTYTLFWTNTSPNGGVYTRKLYLRK